jgi:hypothetical protein
MSETGTISKEGRDKVSEMIERQKQILIGAYDSPQMRAFRFRESLLKRATEKSK